MAVTLTGANAAVAKQHDGRHERGYLYVGSGVFVSDRSDEDTIADAKLRARAADPFHELTYTCVPPGSGRRIGIDRNENGMLDGDEDGGDDGE